MPWAGEKQAVLHTCPETHRDLQTPSWESLRELTSFSPGEDRDAVVQPLLSLLLTCVTWSKQMLYVDICMWIPTPQLWLKTDTHFTRRTTSHLLPFLQATVIAVVGMVLYSGKIATELWPVCSWGFSSPCCFGHITVGAEKAVSQRGCSQEGISALGFAYPYPLGQVACWPLPELEKDKDSIFLVSQILNRKIWEYNSQPCRSVLSYGRRAGWLLSV